MAPVLQALQKDNRFSARSCVTAQHRQMLDQVLSLFGIVPDHDLNVMKHNQTLLGLTSNILQGLQPVIEIEQPDVILVHGDTTTTLAASMVAYYSGVKLGHIEAGLRTGELSSPWPEEGNRKVTSALASFHFAPTENARQNLLRENVDSRLIEVTGNTVIDSLMQVQNQLENDSALSQQLAQQFDFLSPGKRTILVTGHRRENFGGGFERICLALRELARRFPDCQIVYPVHLNPNVQGQVRRIIGGETNIFLIEPQEYLQFVYLMSKSDLILTDSGGVQEEGPFLGKPVLVMRDVTERPEAVAAGTVRLVGTDSERIVEQATNLLTKDEQRKMMINAENPYGDGKASSRIIERLILGI